MSTMYERYIEEAMRRGYYSLGNGPYYSNRTGIVNMVWFIPRTNVYITDNPVYHTSWLSDDVMVGYVELNKPSSISMGDNVDRTRTIIPYVSNCSDLTQSHQEWINEIKDLIGLASGGNVGVQSNE